MNNVTKHTPANRTLAVINGGLNDKTPIQTSSATRQPKLLDQVRQAIRTRHYSYRTEKAYVHWIKRFIFFHNKRHPAEMGEAEIGRFLSALATELHVSASTQNQALNAVLFLYKEVLSKQIGFVDGVVRAKRPHRLPVVLTRQEIRSIFEHLEGVNWIMAMLLYGAGLRLMECVRLRVKDIDLAGNQILVRAGKGDKDRHTMLPAAVKEPLSKHLERTKHLHQYYLQRGLGRVSLPNALERKYPNASKDWGWQWVFSASSYFTDRLTGEKRHHHLHESVLRKAVKEAVRNSGVNKPASPHTFRHSVRHASVRRGLRHPNRSGVARASGCEHDNDLYSRFESRRQRSFQPSRSAMMARWMVRR